MSDGTDNQELLELTDHHPLSSLQVKDSGIQGHGKVGRVSPKKGLLGKLQDFWFVFDFLLAFFMVLETWVIALAGSAQRHSGKYQ